MVGHLVDHLAVMRVPKLGLPVAAVLAHWMETLLVDLMDEMLADVKAYATVVRRVAMMAHSLAVLTAMTWADK